MNIPAYPHKSTVNQDRSWATTEALAILAVDNIRPTAEGVKLMHAIDSGEISHDDAIASILLRAKKLSLTQLTNVR